MLELLIKHQRTGCSQYVDMLNTREKRKRATPKRNGIQQISAFRSVTIKKDSHRLLRFQLIASFNAALLSYYSSAEESASAERRWMYRTDYCVVEAFCSVINLLTRYHSGDNVKKTGMGRACSMYEGEKRCLQGFSGKTWGKDLGGPRCRWEGNIKMDL